MNSRIEEIGDPFYLHAIYIGKGHPELKRDYVYELRCVYDDRLGYVVTVVETGRSYAYPDERCYPIKLQRDWQIVQPNRK